MKFTFIDFYNHKPSVAVYQANLWINKHKIDVLNIESITTSKFLIGKFDGVRVWYSYREYLDTSAA